MDSTYISSDDSELLRRAAARYTGRSCLEVGFGYASNLLDLCGRFALIVGTELKRSDGFARLIADGRASPILADKASCFREQCFDLILVNPPYLPSEGIEDQATDGGRNGFEVPARILEDAVRVLSPGGRILVVLSSETSGEDFFNFCEDRNFSSVPVMTKPLFFEELTVYEVRRKDLD